MKVLSFEKLKKNNLEKRESVANVIDRYNRMYPADPAIKKANKMRNPDEEKVLSRFKLK
ncbi:hypothetical protein M3557_11315 [Bhargavaea ginsengi]|uniref:hypothetical protein n=1 Tax=Bhargavaea ginsengi TaxID=426757 RepID=UPI00203AFAA5|nr:hypothetical protein [Bhargavaea ginsengi]MCM3088508.1 hypothetical protein [Bhargavaea ginsengi]